MQRMIRRISTIVYALGIVSALTFGASQAFGRAVQLTCWYDPPTRLGACVNWDENECWQRCKDANPWDSLEVQGRCVQGGPEGCCVCLL
jgi:hypothetical protein